MTYQINELITEAGEAVIDETPGDERDRPEAQLAAANAQGRRQLQQVLARNGGFRKLQEAHRSAISIAIVSPRRRMLLERFLARARQSRTRAAIRCAGGEKLRGGIEQTLRRFRSGACKRRRQGDRRQGQAVRSARRRSHRHAAARRRATTTPSSKWRKRATRSATSCCARQRSSSPRTADELQRLLRSSSAFRRTRRKKTSSRRTASSRASGIPTRTRSNPKEAEEKFKEIREAYEVLGDSEKRKKYDVLGPDWQQAARQAEQQRRYRTNYDGAGVRFRKLRRCRAAARCGPSGFSDFFDMFFSGVGRAARRRRKRTGFLATGARSRKRRSISSARRLRRRQESRFRCRLRTFVRAATAPGRTAAASAPNATAPGGSSVTKKFEVIDSQGHRRRPAHPSGRAGRSRGQRRPERRPVFDREVCTKIRHTSARATISTSIFP